MAEEIKEEQQAKAQALFKVLSAKDISAEDLAKAAEQIKSDPKILTNIGFISNIKMPDMVSGHQAKSDLGQMLYESAKSQKDLQIVLDNLAKIDLPMHGKTLTLEGKPRTAANYFLDNARLQNGEIIGTQMVKNMHFMGNILKDKPHPLYADSTKNQAAKSDVKAHLERAGAFYPKLYTSYGANHNARNALGQKVDQLMDAYLEENKSKKATTIVEDKPKRPTTRAEVMDNIYQGKTITAEDKKLIQDDTKEAELENVDDPRNKYSGYNHKGEKFRDEDMTKYIYEECFLALLSWGFDKVEEGVEIAVDYTLDGLRKLSERQKIDASETKNKNLKGTLNKVASFGEETDKMATNFAHAAPLQTQKFINLKRDLDGVDFAMLDAKKEDKLKEKYGENIINAFKANPSKLKQLQNMSDEDIKNLTDHIKVAGECALMLSRIEMVDEVMRSDGKWRDNLTGEYLTNDELIAGDKGLVARAEKRQKKIMLAVQTLSEDARALAQAEYGALKTDAEKKAWVEKNIIGEYKDLSQSQNITPERRAKLTKESKKFEEKYAAGMGDDEVIKAYSALKVNTYMDGLAQACQEACQKQTEFHKDEKYDAIGKAPSKDVKSIIDEADKVTEQVIDKGVGYTRFFGRKQSGTTPKKTLEEEAMSYMTAFPLEEMLSTVNTTISKTEGRPSIAERKQHVDQIKAQRNQQWDKKVSAQYAPIIHGGRI